MTGKIKLGRPFADTPKGELTKITFRVDDETLAALEALEARTGTTKAGRQRSELLRKLILDAFSKEDV